MSQCEQGMLIREPPVESQFGTWCIASGLLWRVNALSRGMSYFPMWIRHVMNHVPMWICPGMSHVPMWNGHVDTCEELHWDMILSMWASFEEWTHSVMSHIWMSHVTYVSMSCRIYEWVTSNIRMSHAAQVNMLCSRYEWVMSHIWMSRVPHINESYRTHEKGIRGPPFKRQKERKKERKKERNKETKKSEWLESCRTNKGPWTETWQDSIHPPTHATRLEKRYVGLMSIKNVPMWFFARMNMTNSHWDMTHSRTYSHWNMIHYMTYATWKCGPWNQTWQDSIHTS